MTFEGWVARDKSGAIYAYSEMPYRVFDRYLPNRNSIVFELPRELFTDVTFEGGAQAITLRMTD